VREQSTESGAELHTFASKLYPICRSITGQGVRKTLELIGRRLPLVIHEVPTGRRVFDWEVPLEWNIEDAWIKDPDGRKVVDFRAHNLHVVSYSEPAHAKVNFTDLLPRLHSLPGRPDWIPYRTTYYRRQWGFCMPHADLERLGPGNYEVRVEASLAKGSLTYGEFILPGRTKREILLFTHVCHPSLANDNTSGMAVATELGVWLASEPRRFSYRIVFAPGTIGSLCWLKQNESRLGRVESGLVLGLLGDAGALTYKRSRRGDADIDRVAPFVLQRHEPAARTIAFEPYGYDERQLCSPGFNLPVGRLTRSVNDGYPEYHTSADNLELISPGSLSRSLAVCREIVTVLEDNRSYVNLQPKGEPQLGKRGLYGAIGGRSPSERQHAMLWLLNQSDGSASLLDVAERSGIEFGAITSAANDLANAGLLRPTRHTPSIVRPTRASKASATSKKKKARRNMPARKVT
jgi:aminopeptidase-like protein